jgi:hypothetical protein
MECNKPIHLTMLIGVSPKLLHVDYCPCNLKIYSHQALASIIAKSLFAIAKIFCDHKKLIVVATQISLVNNQYRY